MSGLRVLIIHECTMSLHLDQVAYPSGSFSSDGILIEPLTKLNLFLEFKAKVMALFQVGKLFPFKGLEIKTKPG